MLQNIGKHRVLWLSAALLSLAAATVGVANPSIYDEVVSKDIMPGVFSQDLFTLGASLAALLLAFRTGERDTLRQIAALGIMGYLFYGYGIYVIEQVYTALYFAYLAVFGLASYAIVFFLADVYRENLPKVRLPHSIRMAAVVFLLLNAVMFSIIWTSQLLPLIQSADRIDYLYSIYILDLCFIMPAFVVVAAMAVKKQALGLLLTPALLVTGFTVLAPLALAEALKPPLYDLAMDTASLGLFLALSTIFLALAALYFWKIEIKPE
ncbi:MAG TPA: hypothetical protein ENN54_01595 [Thermoplasmatales archaeon]|nr:hypothetical protein [Thermoplasmatales archaeon]